MLMDKGYYDYDFEKPKAVVRQRTYEETVKSDAEIREMLGRFGWRDTKPRPAPEEMQRIAMAEEETKRATR